MTLGQRALLLFCGLLAVVIIAWTLRYAEAHGDYAWIEDYRAGGTVVTSVDDSEEWLEPSGGGCCGKDDVTVISTRKAQSARVGSVIEARFGNAMLKVKVTKIYPTQDRHGRAFLSRHGCLFRQSMARNRHDDPETGTVFLGRRQHAR